MDKKEVIVIKKETLLTYFLISVLAIGLVLIGYSFITTMEKDSAEKALEEEGKQIVPVVGLNCTTSVPIIWELSQDIDITAITEAATMSAKSEKFNLYKHPLVAEVVPVLMFNGRGDSAEGVGYKQFFSLSFKAADEKQTDAQLTEALKKELDSILKDQEGYKEHKIVKEATLPSGGVYLEAVYTIEVTKDGSTEKTNMPIYYAQYTKKIGKNLATAIIGSRVPDDRIPDTLTGAVDNIIIP